MQPHGHMQQFDSVVAAGAITSPAWVPFFENAMQFYLLIGGAVLLTIRILLASLDLWRLQRERTERRRTERRQK